MDRLFFSRRAKKTSIEELLTMATGRGYWGYWLRDLWLRIKCRLSGGHHMTIQRWANKDDLADGEWHHGCRDCPVFFVKK